MYLFASVVFAGKLKGYFLLIRVTFPHDQHSLPKDKRFLLCIVVLLFLLRKRLVCCTYKYFEKVAAQVNSLLVAVIKEKLRIMSSDSLF